MFLVLSVQIDLLAEIGQTPLILSDVDAALKVKQMKTDVDEYLKVSGCLPLPILIFLIKVLRFS